MLSKGKIVLDDELHREIQEFGYRFPDLNTTTRSVTLLPTFDVDETDFRMAVRAMQAERTGKRPHALGRGVPGTEGAPPAAPRPETSGPAPRGARGRKGAPRSVTSYSLVVDAPDEIMDGMGPVGIESRKALVALDPQALHQLMEINRSLGAKRRDRKKRMDALGIFPPEFNDVRSRTMLRVEHRRAMNNDRLQKKAGRRRSPSRGASGGKASTSAPLAATRTGGLGDTLGPVPEEGRGSPTPRNRGSRESPSPRGLSPPHSPPLRAKMAEYAASRPGSPKKQPRPESGHATRPSTAAARAAVAAPSQAQAPPPPPDRKVAKEQTLLGRMEALLATVGMMDLPEAAVQGTSFNGLRRPRAVDVQLIREGLQARRREKEEDDFWDQHGAGTGGQPGKILVDSMEERRERMQDAQRAARTAKRMARYKDARRSQMAHMLDGLGVDLPPEETRMSALVTQTLRARRDQAAEAARQANDVVAHEAAAMKDLPLGDLVLLAKVGMMDAISQLEFLKSDPLTGGEPHAQQGGPGPHAPGGTSRDSVQAEAARLRGTASVLHKLLQDENSALMADLSVQRLCDEATRASGFASLGEIAAKSAVPIIRTRTDEASRSIRRAATARLRPADSDAGQEPRPAQPPWLQTASTAGTRAGEYSDDDDNEWEMSDVGLPRLKQPAAALAAAQSGRHPVRTQAPPHTAATPETAPDESLPRTATNIRVLKALRTMRRLDSGEREAEEQARQRAAEAAAARERALRDRSAAAPDPALAPSRSEVERLGAAIQQLDTYQVPLPRTPPARPPLPPLPASPSAFQPPMMRPDDRSAPTTPRPFPTTPRPSTPPKPPSAAASLQARLEVVWDSLHFPALDRARMGDKYTSDEHSARFTDALRVWEVAAAAVIQREAALRHLVHLQAGIAGGLHRTELLRLREVLSAVRVAHGTAIMARDSLRDAFGDALTFEGRYYPPQGEEIGAGELRHLWNYALEKSIASGQLAPGQFPTDPFL